MAEQDVTRREVLGRTVAGAAAIAVVSGGCGALGGCQVEKKKEAMVMTGVVNIGPASNYPAGTANTALVAKYGIVVVNDSGTPLAIRPKCTHMGCIAKWDAADFEFECPCHGSRFDLLGMPVKGPAKRALPAVVPERQPNGTLTVDLDKLYAM